MHTNLRGTVAIVGAAESDIGEVASDLTPLDLIGQAAARAAADAGLRIQDIDGLFSANPLYPLAPLDIAEYLGIRPQFTDGTMLGGSSFESHLFHAAAAIEAGLCTTALIVYGSNQRTAAGGLVNAARPLSYEEPYGLRYPVSVYALAASRHMHQYGTTREQLAEVAVAARQWAALNPHAFIRDQLTIEDVLASRMISWPLTVRDCCLVTDGGGAVIVTSVERAQDLKHRPIVLLGAGEATENRHISQMHDLTTTAAVASGARAYEMAAIRPTDVDVALIYDAFTINVILAVEDLQFCDKGSGGLFVSDGHIAPGGQFPVNPNGGGLSYCHPGMNGLNLLIEAVRQLRGEALGAQVDSPTTALVHGNGGDFSSQVTVILGTPDAV